MTNDQHNTDPMADLRKAIDKGEALILQLLISRDGKHMEYSISIPKPLTPAQQIAEWTCSLSPLIGFAKAAITTRIDAAIAEREAEQRRKDAEIARTFYAWANPELHLTTAEEIARRIEKGGAK